MAVRCRILSVQYLARWLRSRREVMIGSGYQVVSCMCHEVAIGLLAQQYAVVVGHAVPVLHKQIIAEAAARTKTPVVLLYQGEPDAIPAAGYVDGLRDPHEMLGMLNQILASAGRNCAPT